MQHNRPNRLITQSSPYLIQHAYNPVDWYPWGEDALKLSKDSDRPILLSIGYSSCHWCHVMEHECFENHKIADLMNSGFVCIKVDREERPDLDAIYMEAVQMIAGQGGWPMTVFLTPECYPFYAGTYFPPVDMYGRPGFPRVLQSVSDAWRTSRNEILHQSKEIQQALAESVESARQSEKQQLDVSILNLALSNIIERIDTRYGGVGTAPKFPMPSLLDYLLRSYLRTGNNTAYREAERWLSAMLNGGIFDQLGGGFHRYSTDTKWLIPHFEKMLYDNAQLVSVYLNAFRISGNQEYLHGAITTLDFVMREMQDSDGGFYSSLDADSDGVEGKFYIWQKAEIDLELDEFDAGIFIARYGVTSNGNFENANILHPVKSIPEVASALGLSEDVVIEKLHDAELKLFEVRNNRKKPFLDDKVITSWNSLMLSAFAEVGACINSNHYLAAAQKCAEFLIENMLVVDSNGMHKLFRTWRLGKAAYDGTLEDYAAFGCSLITLYEATGTAKYLEVARELANTILDHFSSNNGGYYSTSDFHERLIVRPIEWLDGAFPSGNALTAELFIRLSRHLDTKLYIDKASQIFDATVSNMIAFATSFGRMLCSLDMYIGPNTEVCILGDQDSDTLYRFRAEVYSSRILNKSIAFSDSDDSSRQNIPLLAGKNTKDGKPTAYICHNFTCSEPITSVIELRHQLEILQAN